MAAAAEVGGPPFCAVEVGGRAVLLGRTEDGAIRAFDAACPHLGNPLRQGELDGCELACPHHFYTYDLRSGRNVFPGDDRDLSLTVHDVRVVDGQVEVRLRDGAPGRPGAGAARSSGVDEVT